MLKKIIFSVLILSLVSFSFALAQDQMIDGAMMDDKVMEDQMIMGGSMGMSIGPVIYGQMVHVYFDLLIFIVALFLVIKIGSGKIRYPIITLALGFLVSALIPVFFGHSFMWLVALIKSGFGLLSILLFIQAFGGISLIFPKKD